MFGYIVVNGDKLTDEQKKTYQSFYCGLCFSLNKKYGKSYSILLNNDMTFLALVLCGLEDTNYYIENKKCPIHLLKHVDVNSNKFIDYACDMTILLSYFKALDDQIDEHRNIKLVNKLTVPIQNIKEYYPEHVKNIEDALNRIANYEKENCHNLDLLCNASGDIVKTIFSFPNISFKNDMEGLGLSLGKFIYLMDAYDDLEKDLKKNNFNPLIELKDEKDFDSKIERYLELFLSDATYYFERMPIIEYSDIIRNVLYSGVWTRFEQIKKKKEVER